VIAVSAREWRWVLVVVMVAGFAFALRPIDADSPENWFPQSDKLAHLVFFALLWWLGRRARLASAAGLAIGFLAFAVAIEVAQAFFTAGRTASVADVVADASGLLLGAWITGRLEAAGSVREP
jgi:VanZ family protein